MDTNLLLLTIQNAVTAVVVGVLDGQQCYVATHNLTKVGHATYLSWIFVIFYGNNQISAELKSVFVSFFIFEALLLHSWDEKYVKLKRMFFVDLKYTHTLREYVINPSITVFYFSFSLFFILCFFPFGKRFSMFLVEFISVKTNPFIFDRLWSKNCDICESGKIISKLHQKLSSSHIWWFEM